MNSLTSMAKRTPGYSFLEEAQNQFRRINGAILISLVNNTVARSRMIDGIDHGIIDWNHDEGKQWLTRAKELQKQLFALIHMTYGQPSRAEEREQTDANAMLQTRLGNFMQASQAAGHPLQFDVYEVPCLRIPGAHALVDVHEQVLLHIGVQAFFSNIR